MAKIAKISEIHPTLGFTEFDILEKYRKSFHESGLGRLHSLFLFECMAKAAGLSEQRLGRRNIFSPSAKIALMVLKAYTGFSDRQLVEHLNGNMHYQIFCGIFLKNSSVKGMGSIASTVLYSDIHRITRNVFLRMQQKLMNVRVKRVAADSIYANNANRKFCTKYGISTSFVRKGRAAQDEPLRKVLRSELSKERATRLEGSFGTQKQHYSLARIKARNKKTEILWIFFGIHTANAILMINKIRNRTGKAA